MSDSSENKPHLKQRIIDASVGVGLLVAVGLVFLFRGDSSSPDEKSRPAGESEIQIIDESDETPRHSARQLRLAVTQPEYDDMGKLLDTLGTGYRYKTISYDALLDHSQLAEYDVVFLTCGGVPRSWVDQRVRDGARGGPGVFTARPEIVDALRTSLRRYVGHGGTLYVSDLHFKLLGIAFADFIDQDNVSEGEIQTIRARVVDPGLAKRLGSTIELRFEMRAWRPAAFHGPEVTTYLEGDIDTLRRGRVNMPLLVSFPYQEGSIIFTSFHNEAQQTKTEMELLRHLVFTTVTAREVARIKRTMVRGGISPKQRNLLSASEGGEPITESYQCSGADALQFVLGFEDQGARLGLSVIDPSGRKHTKTATKTFTIEIPDPAPGEWKYTITPLDVPYRNFPFTLTIGEKR